MGRILSVFLIICLIVPFSALAELETDADINVKRDIYKYIGYNVFDDIRWGDSSEYVQSIMGRTRLQKPMFQDIDITFLLYYDIQFGSFTSSSCQFIFLDNELISIIFDFLDIDFKEGFEFLYDSLVFGFNASLGDYDEEITDEYGNALIWHIPDGTDVEISNKFNGRTVSIDFSHKQSDDK